MSPDLATFLASPNPGNATHGHVCRRNDSMPNQVMTARPREMISWSHLHGLRAAIAPCVHCTYIHRERSALWRFDWDPAKAEANLRRHGVSFDEAQTAFYDDHALLIDDPDHSRIEERFVLTGLTSKLRLLVVVHCSGADDNVIRIISARRATPTERSHYYWRRHR